MSTTPAKPALARRGLLSILPLPALAPLGVAAPSPSPDADLIRACRRWMELWESINAPNHALADWDYDDLPEWPELAAVEEAICNAAPQTTSGLSAMAGVALRCARGMNERWEDNTAHRIAHIALRRLRELNEVAGELPALGRSAPKDADAELIRICAEHPAQINAVNHGADEGDDGPSWRAYERSLDAIHSAVPISLAGMMAKARAAKAEALTLNGREHPENSPAAYWAWDLVNDLLRLGGEA